MKLTLWTTVAALSIGGSVQAFSAINHNHHQAPETTCNRRNFVQDAAAATAAAWMTGAILVASPERAMAAAAATASPSKNAKQKQPPTTTVVQQEINAFEDLIYNFRDQTLNGGLDASTLNEPSVSFLEFGERMKKGEVAFVEFLAPSGNVAYVTFKPSAKGVNVVKGGKSGKADGKSGKAGGAAPQRIRIGQGYPIESKNSWSSPAFVIRAVSNYGVPYKFTVPALEKFRTK